MPEHSLFVLDTHIWIWFMDKADVLSQTIVDRINEAAQQRRIMIAAISFWEVCLLVQKNRIDFSKDVLAWLNDALLYPGLITCPLTPAIAAESCCLPDTFHGDPADRLIVATARIEKAILLTRDKDILNYGSLGHVKVLAA